MAPSFTLFFQEFVQTQPMPVIVARTLNRIEEFLKRSGLKCIDLFRRADVNTSLATRGDELLSKAELFAMLKVLAVAEGSGAWAMIGGDRQRLPPVAKSGEISF